MRKNQTHPLLALDELFDEHASTPEYLVWNPSTRSYRNLPISTTFDSSFDDRRYYFGFGYDYSIHDYKLIIKVLLQMGAFKA